MRVIGLSNLQSHYDVVIIGSGIAGLACGAYLAKAGIKTLIVEYHSIPGGYCTSFKRGDFTFDIGVHYLGNQSEGGVVGRFIRDHDIGRELNLKRINPSDVIMTPDFLIKFTPDFEETLQNIQKPFPKEAKKIAEFCRLLNSDNFLVLYKKFRNKTFRAVLDEWFENEKLKQVFCTMLGNIGLPSTMVSALTVAVMYRDYIFRGGYYPQGGMQRFPDVIAKRYIEYGGDLLLNKSVTKINIKGDRTDGVVIENDHYVSCDYVVSNCSAKQTFIEMIGINYLPADLTRLLQRLTPSPSAFTVYFSLKKSLKGRTDVYPTVWYCPSYNIDQAYWDCMHDKVNTSGFLFCAIPSLHDETLAPAGYESGHLIILTPYLDASYWTENKQRVEEALIKNAENIIPNFSQILHKTYPATPLTIVHYTKADRGAIYGWASTLEQSGQIMPSSTFINNLYLTGHWTTLESGQGGITMVILSGSHTAKSIIRRYAGQYSAVSTVR